MKSSKKGSLYLPICLVLAVLVLAGGIFLYKSRLQAPEREENVFTADEIKVRVLEYIKESVAGDMTASVVNIEEKKGVYELDLKIGEQEFTSYTTKDGRFLFPSGIDLDEFFSSLEASKEVSKSEVPDVKLFVMSYCPFGLQAEKALLPGWRLLKDEANIGIYFVNYIMHEKKEIDENLRQYCIQKEESEKYTSYLECFAGDGDYENCLDKTAIDQGRLSLCMEQADDEFKVSENYENKDSWLNGKYPKFEIHSDLNIEYKISGSPTLVINGRVANIQDRSPEAFKEAICEAFETRAEECSQKLSEEAASPGFGWETGGPSGACK